MFRGTVFQLDLSPARPSSAHTPGSNPLKPKVAAKLQQPHDEGTPRSKQLTRKTPFLGLQAAVFISLPLINPRAPGHPTPPPFRAAPWVLKFGAGRRGAARRRMPACFVKYPWGHAGCKFSHFLRRRPSSGGYTCRLLPVPPPAVLAPPRSPAEGGGWRRAPRCPRGEMAEPGSLHQSPAAAL